MKNSSEELLIESAEVNFALYSFRASFIGVKPKDKETFCAWCDKSVAEIGKNKLIKHLKDHEKDEKR